VLFAVENTFTGSGTEVAQWVVRIDPATGATTQIVQTFLFAGSSFDFDGISAYDPLNHIYYYTGNVPSSAVFRVNTDTGLPLPTVYYSGATVVSTMVYDVAHQRLVMMVLGQNQQGKTVGMVVAIPETGPVTTLLQVPNTVNLQWIVDSAINGNILYGLFKTGKDKLITMEVAALDISKPNSPVVKEAALSCTGYADKVVPLMIAYDAKSTSLVGHAEVLISNTTVVYGVVSIQANPTASNFGACSVTLLNLDLTKFVITTAAFDPVERYLYYNVIGQGSQLAAFDIATNKAVKTINIKNSPINMEYSPN
jgi:hypothetical protein